MSYDPKTVWLAGSGTPNNTLEHYLVQHVPYEKFTDRTLSKKVTEALLSVATDVFFKSGGAAMSIHGIQVPPQQAMAVYIATRKERHLYDLWQALTDGYGICDDRPKQPFGVIHVPYGRDVEPTVKTFQNPKLFVSQTPVREWGMNVVYLTAKEKQLVEQACKALDQKTPVEQLVWA